MGSVLILGAKSEIAKALAREYASHGYDLVLAGRQVTSALKGFASDVRIRTGCSVSLREMDILEFGKHRAFYGSLGKGPEGVVCCVGYLGNQEAASTNYQELKKITDTNFTAVASFLNIIAADFENRGRGFIVAVSSVAGDRGRKKNYVYGAAKAALTTYLSGLRARLHPSGVQVLTVKPGFVRTRMTDGMELPSFLTATPEEAAKAIYRAQQGGKDVVYVKRRWRFIMALIKLIPEGLFKSRIDF